MYVCNCIPRSVRCFSWLFGPELFWPHIVTSPLDCQLIVIGLNLIRWLQIYVSYAKFVYLAQLCLISCEYA